MPFSFGVACEPRTDRECGFMSPRWRSGGHGCLYVRGQGFSLHLEPPQSRISGGQHGSRARTRCLVHFGTGPPSGRVSGLALDACLSRKPAPLSGGPQGTLSPVRGAGGRLPGRFLFSRAAVLAEAVLEASGTALLLCRADMNPDVVKAFCFS